MSSIADELDPVRLTFQRSHDRSLKLLELHRVLHGKKGRPSRLVSDVVRSALVLSAASLDAAIAASLAIAAPYALRKGLLGQTAKTWAVKDDSLVEALVTDDPPQFLRQVVEQKLANTSLQKPQAIQSMLYEILSCPPPWDRAKELLQGEAEEPSVISVKWIQEELEQAILRRHRIVHDGDINPTAKTAGSTTPIYRDTVERWIWVIGKVGIAVVDVAELHLA